MRHRHTFRKQQKACERLLSETTPLLSERCNFLLSKPAEREVNSDAKIRCYPSYLQLSETPRKAPRGAHFRKVAGDFPKAGGTRAPGVAAPTPFCFAHRFPLLYATFDPRRGAFCQFSKAGSEALGLSDAFESRAATFGDFRKSAGWTGCVATRRTRGAAAPLVFRKQQKGARLLTFENPSMPF